jgi:flavin-dependent thymidylate synthase
MKVKLLESGHLSSIVVAGRTCYSSFHLGGNYYMPTDEITEVDVKYLDRLINKHGHASISRHCQYVFQIEGISTKTLLSSTRHGPGVNFSVMSSRFCKLDKFGSSFTNTPNEHVNTLLIKHTNEIIELNQKEKISAEDLAMLYPQAFHYDMIVSFNPQSLQHFLNMRFGEESHAHFDVQELADRLLNAVPETHKFMFKQSKV